MVDVWRRCLLASLAMGLHAGRGWGEGPAAEGVAAESLEGLSEGDTAAAAAAAAAVA